MHLIPFAKARSTRAHALCTRCVRLLALGFVGKPKASISKCFSYQFNVKGSTGRTFRLVLKCQEWMPAYYKYETNTENDGLPVELIQQQNVTTEVLCELTPYDVPVYAWRFTCRRVRSARHCCSAGPRTCRGNIRSSIRRTENSIPIFWIASVFRVFLSFNMSSASHKALVFSESTKVTKDAAFKAATLTIKTRVRWPAARKLFSGRCSNNLYNSKRNTILCQPAKKIYPINGTTSTNLCTYNLMLYSGVQRSAVGKLHDVCRPWLNFPYLQAQVL